MMQVIALTAKAVWQDGLLATFLSALAIGTLLLMRFPLARYSKLNTADKPLYVKRYVEGQKLLARYEIPVIRYLIRVTSIVLCVAVIVTIAGVIFYFV